MENQLPMPYPSDEPDETVDEYIDLDTMPDDALARLLEIELPRLTPTPRIAAGCGDSRYARGACVRRHPAWTGWRPTSTALASDLGSHPRALCSGAGFSVA